MTPEMMWIALAIAGISLFIKIPASPKDSLPDRQWMPAQDAVISAHSTRRKLVWCGVAFAAYCMYERINGRL